MADKDNLYFAAKPSSDLACILLERAQSFYSFLNANEYLVKVLDNWRYYYGFFGNSMSLGHHVSYTGEQGELVSLPVNHYRNIAEHIKVMITAVRPIMEARAVNTDYKSLAQAYLANGILDYYMREQGLEEALKLAVEMGIALGSGFIKMEWNSTAGDKYDYDSDAGTYSYTGEVEFTNLSPFDVVFDGTRETYKPDWVLTRSFKNRYDLMAKYPELAEKIRNVPVRDYNKTYRLALWTNDQTDDVAVYEFFHKKTESMPEGRYLLFLDQDVQLMDAPLPYRSLPVFRITPANIMGTPYGYSPMFDIFPLQEALNSLYSTILTNQNAFGVQSIFVPRGSDIAISSLEGGLNIMQGNEPPVPIQLTSTPKETFQFIEMMIQAIETLSAVNSVTRGQPEASLKSGNALALVQSMAIQYISGFQQSYVKLVEEIGTQLINNLKDFAKAPRVAAIVGKNNRTMLKEFTGDDLVSINRVIVDIGNPLSRTTAGRVQMAEQMLQMNLIKTPSEYFQVINTGKLDTVFENDLHQLLLIKQENEKMMEGRDPLVAPGDLHSTHIKEHNAVLSDSDIRDNPEITRVVMDHIQRHMDALTNTDPRLLMIIGEQPLPPAQPMMHPPLMAPMPRQQGEEGSAAPVMQQEPGLSQAGEMINNQSLPAPASPPPPFEGLPTNPANNLIQG